MIGKTILILRMLLLLFIVHILEIFREDHLQLLVEHSPFSL